MPSEKTGADLAGSHRSCAQPSRLWIHRRYSSDDQPLRLRAIAILAVAADRRSGSDHGGVRGAAAAGGRKRGNSAVAGRGRMDVDGVRLATDPSLLRRLAVVGRGIAGDRVRLPGVYAGLGLAALAWQRRHGGGAGALSGTGQAGLRLGHGATQPNQHMEMFVFDALRWSVA